MQGVCAGAAEPGGPGGPGPPQELKIYRVKILKIHKMSFFLLFAPPQDKICSSAPDYMVYLPITYDG